jgi:hypothetical protein
MDTDSVFTTAAVNSNTTQPGAKTIIQSVSKDGKLYKADGNSLLLYSSGTNPDKSNYALHIEYTKEMQNSDAIRDKHLEGSKAWLRCIKDTNYPFRIFWSLPQLKADLIEILEAHTKLLRIVTASIIELDEVIDSQPVDPTVSTTTISTSKELHEASEQYVLDKNLLEINSNSIAIYVLIWCEGGISYTMCLCLAMLVNIDANYSTIDHEFAAVCRNSRLIHEQINEFVKTIEAYKTSKEQAVLDSHITTLEKIIATIKTINITIPNILGVNSVIKISLRKKMFEVARQIKLMQQT